jgi:hypothetical protein
MNKWMKRVRGALGMGFTWAIGWAVFGVLVAASTTVLPGFPGGPFFEIFDAPAPALAVPGFIGGILFSIVLGIAARHRRLDEISLPRFALWGALGGLLLALLPDAMAAVGLVTLNEQELGMWEITAAIAAPLIVLCSASAAGSLLLARRAQRNAMLSARKTLGLNESFGASYQNPENRVAQQTSRFS